jgi:Sulfotransferase family
MALRGLLRRADRGHAAAPFVVGVTRSGTTLLRMMLDAHPQLAIPPETYFVPDLIERAGDDGTSADELHGMIVGDRHWGDFNLDPDELLRRLRGKRRLDAGEALRAFYGYYAEREGKPRWGDKTPLYLKSMVDIQGALPEARFVHLLRDGRDAALSRASRALKEPDPPAKVAARWKRRVLRARRQARRLRHYLEVRYEDLVTDSERTLRTVCDFVELDYDPAMLTYHERAEERLEEMARDLPERPGQPRRPAEHRLQAHELTKEPPTTERVARWRREMSPEDVAAWEETAGDLLAELGYDVSAR